MPDELVSSYLTRVAKGYGLTNHYLGRCLIGHQPLWNRDIDKLAPKNLLHAISLRLNIPIQQVKNMCLSSYRNGILSAYNSHGNTPHILPLRVYHRLHLSPGLQFCPLCLKSDETPYYRKSWRLSFITICTKHRCRLLDSCPHCKLPINFHRNEDKKLRITECYQCKKPITKCSAVPIGETQADAEIFNCQETIEKGIRAKKIRLASTKTVAISSYLDVYRQIARSIGRFIRERNVKKVLDKRYKITINSPTLKPKVTFETASVEQRFELFRVAASLLADWPHRFLDFSYQNELWSTDFTRDFNRSPEWFSDVIRSCLDGNVRRKIHIKFKAH